MRNVLRNVQETPTEKISKLEQDKEELQAALAESIEKADNDKLQLQLAIAEAVENLSGGGAK